MKKMWTLAVAAACVAGLQAQTLAQRDDIARDRKSVAEYANRVNTACGTHIRFSVDYASYNAAPGGVDENRHAPSLIIMNPGDALMSVCNTEAGKAAVKEKITSVVLVYTEGEAMTISGGTFTFKSGFKSSAPETIAKWLKTQL